MNPPALDTTQLVAMAAALGWASGLRLYAVLLATGLMGATGWIDLPAGLRLLQHPLVLGASGLMVAVEFLADKVPVVDSLWDAVHTFIRIPAGAALAAGVFGADHAAWSLAAALMGGTLAATAHAAKATTRAAVNTSPEPFSNIGVSLLEDGTVVAAMWLWHAHPVLFLLLLVVALVAMVALTIVLFKFLRAAVRRIGALWRGAPQRKLASSGAGRRD